MADKYIGTHVNKYPTHKYKYKYKYPGLKYKYKYKYKYQVLHHCYNGWRQSHYMVSVIVIVKQKLT